MNRVKILFLALVFSFPALSNTGTPQTGPLVDCKLESGDVVRLTAFMCQQNKGHKV
ncbi:hypothetical protein QF117_09975 [Vibrio sp. YMD68]|uniref:hypothetical protein n=1 Tax=Vibrio sp. YMD68 TaxID=3042300 RepID=UPI00249B2F44|nr:hypothetical protein [Vibrio sp. YMD68]WGW01121.1 hypothetical protein QF117_09975 [Vibrio sp. YMD68]